MSDVSVSGYGDYTGNYGKNALRVEVGRLTLWFSYSTVVAFQFDGPLVVRENDWGPTTGKHLNWIDGGNKKERLDGQRFEQRLWHALNVCNLAKAPSVVA